MITTIPDKVMSRLVSVVFCATEHMKHKIFDCTGTKVPDDYIPTSG